VLLLLLVACLRACGVLAASQLRAQQRLVGQPTMLGAGSEGGKRRLADLAPSEAELAAARKAKKKQKRSQAKLKQKQRNRGHLKEDSQTVNMQPADQQVRPSGAALAACSASGSSLTSALIARPLRSWSGGVLHARSVLAALVAGARRVQAAAEAL
jgi:hypothetical protein